MEYVKTRQIIVHFVICKFKNEKQMLFRLILIQIKINKKEKV